MRKTVTILMGLAIGVQLMAQRGFVPAKYRLDYAKPGKVMMQKKNDKAPGDVIFAEDFNGEVWSSTSDNGVPVPENAPENWTIVDNTGNNFCFRWDTVGPRGIFTSQDDCQIPAGGMMSTTGANGYLMLEADWFNSAPDCTSIYDENMDTYIQYEGDIDFSEHDAVHLVFEQINRFCCVSSSESDAFFKVSIDNGASWNQVSVSVGPLSYGLGQLGGASQFSIIDITNMVAGQTNVWFRFQMQGLSHYYWLIDDLALVQPLDNDIRFVDYWNDYIGYVDDIEELEINESFDFIEGFYEYPWFLSFAYCGFHAAYHNFGGQDQTNFVHNVDIYKNDNLIESFTTDPMALVPVGEKDTTMLEAFFWPEQIAEYEIRHYPSMDNLDDVTINDTLSRKFKIGDSLVRVVDFERVNGDVSPSNWIGFDESGDGLGFVLNIPEPKLHDLDGNPDYYEVNGVMVYVGSNSGEELSLFENEEAKIVASIYRIDDENDSLILIISSAEKTLTLDDTSSVVYIPFIKDFSSEYLFEGGKFLVAINMYGVWYDAFDRLQSWNINNADNTVQKRSRESCVTVNATPETISDIGSIIEGPAFGLDISYTDNSWPIPAPPYLKFIVKNTQGDFIPEAQVDIGGEYQPIMTNRYGRATFAIQTDDLVEFDYVVSHTDYTSVYGSAQIDGENATYSIIMDPLSVSETQMIDFKVYPNPSNGKIQIEGEGAQELRVYNISGQLIYESAFNDRKNIDLSNEAPGIYVISVLKGNQIASKRVIIK